MLTCTFSSPSFSVSSIPKPPPYPLAHISGVLCSFVQHTSLAFSPGTLTGEVASAIEVFHSEVAFQGLKRKVQQLDARDSGKGGGAGMKKADVELLVADRKHQRLLKTLRETEEVLLEQLAMGKVSPPFCFCCFCPPSSPLNSECACACASDRETKKERRCLPTF